MAGQENTLVVWQNIDRKRDTKIGLWRGCSGEVACRSRLEPEGERLKAVWV